MRTITAADADRYFSKRLGEVSRGHTVTITSRGKPVARMVPLSGDERREARRAEAERQRAWLAFLHEIRARPKLGIPITWSRDELYDDDFR